MTEELTQKEDYNKLVLPQTLILVSQMFTQAIDQKLSLHNYSKFIFQSTLPLNPFGLNPNEIKYLYSEKLNNRLLGLFGYVNALSLKVLDTLFHSIDRQTFFHLLMVIRSRALCFDPEDPKHFDERSFKLLTPIVDLLNHSYENNCKIAPEYSMMSDKSFVNIIATKDIQPDEELTLNYGNYSNYELFMRFGFMVNNNPHDFLDLEIDSEK